MLTPLELDIMKAIWEKPPITVKHVQAAIRPKRKLAYTTVMTIMHRMYHKGYLSRRLNARTHLYEPAIAYTDVRDAEIDRVVANFFSGSRDNLLDFLDGTPEPEIRTSQYVRKLDEELL